ncbi:MAG: hypothetical protein JXQ27_02250 [Acidobacteria bacterium]|nr:hypothetical protein [Acidobacteriota bacterium]
MIAVVPGIRVHIWKYAADNPRASGGSVFTATTKWWPMLPPCFRLSIAWGRAGSSMMNGDTAAARAGAASGQFLLLSEQFILKCCFLHPAGGCIGDPVDTGSTTIHFLSHHR